MLALGRLSMRMYGTLFNLTSNNIEIINLHVQLNNSIIGAAAALHSEVTEREIKFYSEIKLRYNLVFVKVLNCEKSLSSYSGPKIIVKCPWSLSR